MNKGTLTVIPMETANNLARLTREEQSSRTDFEVYQGELSSNKVHLFIASHNWKVLDIIVSEDTDLSVIPSMLVKFDKVRFRFICDINPDILNLLCECFPAKQGKLRKAYLLNQSILSILEQEA